MTNKREKYNQVEKVYKKLLRKHKDQLKNIDGGALPGEQVTLNSAGILMGSKI